MSFDKMSAGNHRVHVSRREFLGAAALAALTAKLSLAHATDSPPIYSLGDGELHFLSDGHLSFPLQFPENDADRVSQMKQMLSDAELSTEINQPPCNVTLWKTSERIVLFDIGAGTQFMDSAGQLPSQLEAAGIDPAEITDVVFTHAHPDHCWGLIDDFDELFCPNANYHMHKAEFDYWLSEKTLKETPEAGLGMVAGARNRLPLIQEQLSFFDWGDEVLPGIEAVDSHGHTPGHTSFALHQGGDSVLIVGDALTHPVFSFQKPQWFGANDIDAEVAAQTRIQLLDRMAADNTLIVAFHLPDHGLGRVESSNGEYRFAPELI